MKAECQECGKKLKELYWSKFIEPEKKEQIIALEDFYYCPWCNKIYHREIQTNVLWHKLDCSTSSTKKEKKMDAINPVKDFNRIVNIFVNITGTISIVFEDSDHNIYLLEVEGKITPMNDSLHRTRIMEETS